jgi:ferredoxin
MKCTQIYFSPTGTTRKIVEAVSRELCSGNEVVDLTLPESRKQKISIDPENILVVGAPVYSGRIPVFIEDYLKALDIEKHRVVLLTVYGNRAYEDALIEMKDLFESKQCTIIGAGAFVGEHSCHPGVAGGRPDDDDIEKAKAFGKNLLGKLDRLDSVEVSGKRPYRERKSGKPIGASTYETCIQCQACANNCPMGAISFDDCRVVDEELCIHCFRCVRVCPVEAKYFDERFQPLVKWLEENCTTNRMEPEVFL